MYALWHSRFHSAFGIFVRSSACSFGIRHFHSSFGNFIPHFRSAAVDKLQYHQFARSAKIVSFGGKSIIGVAIGPVPQPWPPIRVFGISPYLNIVAHITPKILKIREFGPQGFMTSVMKRNQTSAHKPFYKLAHASQSIYVEVSAGKLASKNDVSDADASRFFFVL